jgi:hypothetical protein
MAATTGADRDIAPNAIDIAMITAATTDMDDPSIRCIIALNIAATAGRAAIITA